VWIKEDEHDSGADSISWGSLLMVASQPQQCGGGLSGLYNPNWAALLLAQFCGVALGIVPKDSTLLECKLQKGG